MGRREEEVQAEIRSFVMPISRLPGYSGFSVVHGDFVTLDAYSFDWKGSARTLWLCWAARKGDPDWNDGANIPGGRYGYMPIQVQDSTVWKHYGTHDIPIKIPATVTTLHIEITPDLFDMGVAYNAWYWLAGLIPGHDHTDMSADNIHRNDDQEIFTIVQDEIKEAEVGYKVV